MPNRIPTPGISTPAVRKSAMAQPAAKPSYSAPSLSDFKKSAAYKTDSMSYKEYLDASKAAYSARNKAK